MILDTLGRFMKLGGNDDYGGTTEIVGELEKVARQTGCHIIYAHHVGKGRSEDADLSGAALGSAGIETAAQAHIHLRGRAPGITTIEIGDMRVGKTLPEHLLVWDENSDTDSLGEPWRNANSVMLEKTKQMLREFFLSVNPDDWWSVAKLVPEIKGSSYRWVSWAASLLAKDGFLEKQGKGVRGAPYSYRLSPVSTSLTPPDPNRQSDLFDA